MQECPTIQDLAAYVEGTASEAALLAHVPGCRACQGSLEALQGEVQGLQISISELWFREQVSCPEARVLEDHRGGKLAKDLAAYVSFHVEDLGCPYCQARLGDLEVASDQSARKARTRSREKLGEATTRLLKTLRKR